MLRNLTFLIAACAVPAAVFSVAYAVDCNGTIPGNNVACGTEVKCENIAGGGFTCQNSTGWYKANTGVTKCDGNNPSTNDNCHDHPQNKVTCVCKFYCGAEDPATGKCTKGNAFNVPHPVTGQMVQVCAREKVKIQYPDCDLNDTSI